MIAGLLLAAGRGSRFGGDKLGALLAGRPVIEWSAGALRSLPRRYVVVGPDGGPTRLALAGLDVRFVSNADPARGMSSSLRAGIEALAPDVEAVVIALGDQPLVDPRIATLLSLRWHYGNVDAVATRYRGTHGHPVLIARKCFASLLESIEGEAGARRYLSTLGDRLGFVDVDQQVPDDVDTPDVLVILEAQIAG